MFPKSESNVGQKSTPTVLEEPEVNRDAASEDLAEIR